MMNALEASMAGRSNAIQTVGVGLFKRNPYLAATTTAAALRFCKY